MTPEAKEMMKILQNLEKANSVEQNDVSTSTVNNTQENVPSNIREDAKEMYNILSKFEKAQTEATRQVIMETESGGDIKTTAGFKKDNTIDIAEFKVVLEKKNINENYRKTFYAIHDDEGIVYSDIALFESAMAIVKKLIGETKQDNINKIIKLDNRYATLLAESADHKSRMKKVNESFKKDIISAKHSDTIVKMRETKASIKKYL